MEKAGRLLLNYPNVIGYSNTLQKRIRKGRVVDEDVVRVYVTRKVRKEDLKPSEVIPSEVIVEGVKLKTDVVEIGRVRKLSYMEKYRPAPCGVSTSRVDENTAGTIGWWVFTEDGYVYMVSNNHVWAKENQGKRGDPLIQPGRYDGGDPERDVIGYLYDFVPINWAGVNRVDVAVAEPVDYGDVYMSIMEMGGVTGKVVELGYIDVVKVGRTTGVTRGSVFDTSATIMVEYDTAITTFTDVFLAKNKDIAKPGDSGSPVLDTNKRLVGLVFAGGEVNGETFLVGCKVGNIESELSLRLGKRVYALVSNSYPPFRVETKFQVVHSPILWTLPMSAMIALTMASVYKTISTLYENV
ncbi:MAG: hypothetical protein QW503_02325 [Sulfolobales archaeon]